MVQNAPIVGFLEPVQTEPDPAFPACAPFARPTIGGLANLVYLIGPILRYAGFPKSRIPIKRWRSLVQIGFLEMVAAKGQN